ncbi:MAG: hypothetical protein JWN35_2016 [Frankiales bacterium]|jgi:hypothetical protein|nr:hypothetical protein [Frankiales bacterium]
MSLTAARRVADAVLYEGYLLYPYRASSPKNQLRWQFGILGPAGAVQAGVGEEPSMRAQCLLDSPDASGRLDVQLRFLQVQARTVERRDGGQYVGVEELDVAGTRWIGWHEAVEREVPVLDVPVADLLTGRTVTVAVPGGEECELLHDGADVVGRLVRRRWPLQAELFLTARRGIDPRLLVVSVAVDNETVWPGEGAPAPAASPRDVAARGSFIGTHLLLAARGAEFVSLLDGPQWSADDAAACVQSRCWPVLVLDDQGRDAVLVSPIILAERPVVAPESAGDLFDATEIDEILTLRIMTMTDEEKADARGTDPRAAAIIDRCDDMTPAGLKRLHGTRRSTDDEPDRERVPWWDPGSDASVSPGTDAVDIAGTAVAKGSRVLLRPTRRADAQDLFLAGMVGVVTAVYADVDGGTHVAVVLEDDPASDLHEWYGRYYYFGPDELEPLPARTSTGPQP